MAGLNEAPSGERVRIGFFGLRNAGKSSLVNAVTGQDLSVVSDVAGTTTDPVRKAMELLPLGPVEIVDTPGIDDAGELGEMRVKRAREALRGCDAAVLVTDCTRPLQPAEEELLGLFRKRGMPHMVALNKCDLLSEAQLEGIPAGAEALPVSAARGTNVRELKELIARACRGAVGGKHLVADLVSPGDTVVLVVPIDSSAPKGRLILPQQMAVRDVLEARATCAVCQPAQLQAALYRLKEPPKLVVTDSQAFAQVAAIVPRDVPLTSFSILMARYKGDLRDYLAGARAIAALRDGDRVLVSEGCTHHRQCEDIGTVKMPRWIRAACGAEPEFEFTSGGGFPDDLSPYRLVVHCGGCMLNGREMAHRVGSCRQAGVPIVNYGMAIAQMDGILQRSLEPLGIRLERE